MSPIHALFQPIKVGSIELAHRVVLAPMTRYRSDAAHVPTDLGVEMYSQRASVPGTLLITEATFIAPQAGGYAHVPGIWNDAQIAAWKKVSHCSMTAYTLKLKSHVDRGRSAREGVVHIHADMGAWSGSDSGL